MSKNHIQILLGHLRRADQRFDLIQNGDKIAVGLSGGKDSLTLLQCLVNYQKFGLKQFEIIAISIDCTNGKADYSLIMKFCDELGVRLVIEPSQIFEILFEVRKEKSPCSLCSNLRRGRLNSVAKKLGCNKVAMGHHSDDMLETFLLSMIYEARLSTFHPKTYMDKTDLTLIRPLILASEKEIIAFARSKNLPVLENLCPINHKTQREYMKNLVSQIDGEIGGSRERMFEAIIQSERHNLPK